MKEDANRRQKRQHAQRAAKKAAIKEAKKKGIYMHHT